uniref:t-SNARE coiled-coil homology domain-containing protein n=1 Tax=Setaria digitata TaxID=48799 RepID=A0A915Q3D3_9BILA
MSVDKTIEELSYTLAQLGNLVSHINSQIGQLASRINLTLDTFDQSVAGIAIDAQLMSNHVANTISQVPNGWLFYLLLLTIIVVFLLLSITLILGTIKRSFDVYALFKELSTSDSASKKQKGFIMSQENHCYGRERHTLESDGIFKQNHISIPMDMEHEPRRLGLEPNGDLKKRRSPLDTSRRSQHRNFGTDQYGTVEQLNVVTPFSNCSAQV